LINATSYRVKEKKNEKGTIILIIIGQESNTLTPNELPFLRTATSLELNVCVIGFSRNL
jgi:hypothetical protein